MGGYGEEVTPSQTTQKEWEEKNRIKRWSRYDILLSQHETNEKEEGVELKDGEGMDKREKSRVKVWSGLKEELNGRRNFIETYELKAQPSNSLPKIGTYADGNRISTYLLPYIHHTMQYDQGITTPRGLLRMQIENKDEEVISFSDNTRKEWGERIELKMKTAKQSRAS